MWYLLILQTESAVIHPPSPPREKKYRAQIIGPPVHSVSIFHTCTNIYKVTNTRTIAHFVPHTLTCTSVLSHTQAWVSIHRILFRQQQESE